MKLRFKNFQIEDLARAAMHDGVILAWEPGLGKTLAAIAWAIIKRAKRVLLVVPGGLHRQYAKLALQLFGIHITPLPNVKHFYAHRLDTAPHSPVRLGPLRKDEKPRFFITSYEDLGLNGADEWNDTVTDDGVRQTHRHRLKARLADPEYIKVQQVIARLNGTSFDSRTIFEGIGNVRTYTLANGHRHTIKCVWLPTLSRVIAQAEGIGGGFDCVAVDEGTKIQANESHIGLGVRQLDPKFRIVLSGTPIKNRLESIFWLASWACGGSQRPTARWPYEATSEAREAFANHHLQHDRFLTREEESKGTAGNCAPDIYNILIGATVNGNELRIPRQLQPKLYTRVKKVIESLGGRWTRKHQTHVFTRPAADVIAALRPIVPGRGKKQKIEKRTARVCNIHRLWKLLAPIVIRRRKDNCGEDIVKKTIKPIYIQPGTAQQAVYRFHLENPPVAPKGVEYNGSNFQLQRRTQLGMQLGILRQVALCPEAQGLSDVVVDPSAMGAKRSWTDANPKQAAILSLAAELLSSGEQLVVGSPFTAFNESLHQRLLEAGVASVLLDGSIEQDKRGALAERFKAKEFSVMVAGQNAMSLGYSLECCSRLVLASYSHALDENSQFLDRVWRLNSPKEVIVYPMIMRNTVDEVIYRSFGEKDGSSKLCLDGELIEERVEEADTAMLLAAAVAGFDPSAPTVDERDIEAMWIKELKQRLTYAEKRFREFHPIITGTAVNSADIANAIAALNEPSPTAISIAMKRLRTKVRKQG